MVITLRDFVDRVGSEERAALCFGCTQTAINKALARENIYVELDDENKVISAYAKSDFPNKNRTGNTETVIDQGFYLPEKAVA